MLYATLHNTQVTAEPGTDRSDEYVCPSCDAPVVLKDGKVLTTHFAHKIYDETCPNSHIDLDEQRLATA